MTMKWMKKTLAALTMTGLMVAGLGLTVFADENAHVLNPYEVTKHFIMAEGLDVPTETFSFTATAVTGDAPEVTIEDISYSATDNKGTLSDEGIYTLNQNAKIAFGYFPHAGVYEYTVTENSGNTEGITYDLTEYTMRVYVANDENSQLNIQNITAEAADGKQDSLSFTNTYRKTGNLTITKKTVGALADKTRDFTFTITFIKSGTESDDVTSYRGKIGETEADYSIGRETSFQLHDGESLVFDELPVGTRYIVTEAAAEDGYVPSVSVVENEVQTVNGKSGADPDELSTANAGSSNLVGEKENSVIFTNTYPEVPVTGVIVKHLPFLLLIMLPALTLLLPLVIRTRRKLRRKH